MPRQATIEQKKTRKPPRQKHVPMRTCVSCRESGAKRGLTRVVRTPEGDITIDSTGKKNGRGAYLCEKPTCWHAATSTPALSRALKAPLTPQSIERLKEFAATLPNATDAKALAATTEEMT